MDKSHIPSRAALYFKAVISNASTKKGAAAAIAGVMIALIQEALWGTR